MYKMSFLVLFVALAGCTYFQPSLESELVQPSLESEPELKVETKKQVEDTKYVYSDQITNPYTKEEYMIRKTSNEPCGLNGSLTCDLVVERSNGEREVITSLFLPGTAIEAGPPDRRLEDGAELVGFSDANTLVIRSGSKGGVGEIWRVAKYDLKLKELSNDIVVFRKWGAMVEGRDSNISYSVCSGVECLVFINVVFEGDPGFQKTGAYFVKRDTATPVDFELVAPFDVAFDVSTNYKDPRRVKFSVNSKGYIFDFETRQFVGN